MDDLVRIEGCGEGQRDMRHVIFSFERGYGDTGMQQVEMSVEEFIIGCIFGRDSDNFLFVGYECIAVGVGNEKPPFIGYSYSGCFRLSRGEPLVEFHRVRPVSEGLP